MALVMAMAIITISIIERILCPLGPYSTAGRVTVVRKATGLCMYMCKYSLSIGMALGRFWKYILAPREG